MCIILESFFHMLPLEAGTWRRVFVNAYSFRMNGWSCFLYFHSVCILCGCDIFFAVLLDEKKKIFTLNFCGFVPFWDCRALSDPLRCIWGHDTSIYEFLRQKVRSTVYHVLYQKNHHEQSKNLLQSNFKRLLIPIVWLQHYLLLE